MKLPSSVKMILSSERRDRQILRCTILCLIVSLVPCLYAILQTVGILMLVIPPLQVLDCVLVISLVWTIAAIVFALGLACYIKMRSINMKALSLCKYSALLAVTAFLYIAVVLLPNCREISWKLSKHKPEMRPSSDQYTPALPLKTNTHAARRAP